VSSVDNAERDVGDDELSDALAQAILRESEAA
jgi:hypothetical protein